MSYALIQSVTEIEPTAGRSRPKLDRPYLSPSQIKAFERCESAYYASYAKGRREPGNPKLLLGTATHRFAESFNHSTILGYHDDEKIEIAQRAALECLESELEADKAFRWIDTAWSKGPLWTKDLLIGRLTEATTTLVPTLAKYRPIKMEAGYLIEWADGRTLPIFAFTDLIAEHIESGRRIVIDYKTSAKSKADFDLRTDLALTTYAIGEGLTHGNLILKDVGYICVTTTKTMTVTELFDTRYGDDIRRLYNAARVQTLKLRAGLIGMTQSLQNCGKCYHREWCVDEFGGQRPTDADADSNQLTLTVPPLAA